MWAIALLHLRLAERVAGLAYTVEELLLVGRCKQLIHRIEVIVAASEDEKVEPSISHPSRLRLLVAPLETPLQSIDGGLIRLTRKGGRRFHRPVHAPIARHEDWREDVDEACQGHVANLLEGSALVLDHCSERRVDFDDVIGNGEVPMCRAVEVGVLDGRYEDPRHARSLNGRRDRLDRRLEPTHELGEAHFAVCVLVEGNFFALLEEETVIGARALATATRRLLLLLWAREGAGLWNAKVVNPEVHVGELSLPLVARNCELRVVDGLKHRV